MFYSGAGVSTLLPWVHKLAGCATDNNSTGNAKPHAKNNRPRVHKLPGCATDNNSTGNAKPHAENNRPRVHKLPGCVLQTITVLGMQSPMQRTTDPECTS